MNVRIPFFGLFIASALCAFLLYTSADAQINLQAGGGIGFVVASGDLSGTTVDFYNGTKYGFSNGYTLFARARGGVEVVNIMLEAAYTSFSSHGDTEAGQGSASLSQKIITFKAGPEYTLVSLPAAPLKPYLGMNVQLNTFKGESTFNGVSRVPSGTYSIASASRIGIGLEGGLLVSVMPGQQLDINISYNFMNAGSKEFNTVDPNQPRRSDSYLSLNDDADPLFRSSDTIHFISDKRSIHTLMFTVSYLFGL
ncbi:MAG TPA: outer membrane beta-barrel protein [Bacteroidota bacterium]|nr:outer membrane beta-barrel protein [Bacteroidota bacterium]